MSGVFPTFLAFDLPDWFAGNLNWIIGGLIILIGLLLIGFRDLIRFQLKRVWAISGVCFDESIRRRILWITPLAILGVIVISQLQKPNDEQDAMRQTTKFCLFATGFVVVVSTIILACTNLPREIENRVIYTVVTKPTTRLEIVLGKIVGFARVSAAILLIMGLFSLGYLEIRAHSMQQSIQERLDLNAVDPAMRPTLDHYAHGLLNAKTLAAPGNMGIYASIPPVGAGRRYFSDGSVLVPFVLPADTVDISDVTGKSPKKAGMLIHGHVGFERIGAAATQPATPVVLNLEICDTNQNALIANDINHGQAVTLTSSNGTDFEAEVPAADMTLVFKQPFFYVMLMPSSTNVRYWVDQKPASVVVPVGEKAEFREVEPTNPADPSKPAEIVFAGRQGLDGQQVSGSADGNGGVAVVPFRNVPISEGSTASIPIEMRVSIEKGDSDTPSSEAPTQVVLQVRNLKTGNIVDAGQLLPENNRPAYGNLPASGVDGGNFEVIIRCLSPQRWLGLKTDSISVVQSQSSFALNLLKSLFIIWLLTVLVISIAIFASTFLSWPIAIVLTLLILLSHWGVQQLGDAAEAGLGRQFVQDFGIRDPAQAQAISATVEQLNKYLKAVATVLPDIDHFSATEDIERGISIPPQKLWEALGTALGVGFPLAVLAYVFLKYKEVAP